MRSDGVTEIEKPWMELVEERGPVAARDELVSRGFTVAQAAGIAMWLSDQIERRRLSGHSTAVRYRRQLRSVSPPPSKVTGAIPGYVNLPGHKRRRRLGFAAAIETAVAA